ncbi:MAG: hypothetical protein KDA33_01655, partial [Phycisphaerales bacterium]|nr:hypothetical protein [Phycisphaerales bacterium]
GGGVRNELLCQLTADVTGLPVIAGPTEATVIGNLMIQALARRHVQTIDEIREVVGASFPLATYEPDRGADWTATIARFDALVGAPAVTDNDAG